MTPLILAALLALASPAEPGGAGCARLGGGAAVEYYPMNDHTILISAGLRAFRVTTSPSELLDDRSAVINTRFLNSTVVCSPSDLTLQVSSPSGRAGLIAQRIDELSPAEAADLRRGGPTRRRPG